MIYLGNRLFPNLNEKLWINIGWFPLLSLKLRIAVAKPNSPGATGLRWTHGVSWHKPGSAASIHDVQTEKLSSCYRYNNTGWITPDFILLHNTAAATEIRGVINFPAAIYVNTLIPLQIVVLPNQAKQKQLKSQRSLGCQWQQVWFCWEQQSYSTCTAIFYWWAVLTSVQLLQQMNKVFWIYFHIQCDPFKTSV